MYLIPICFDTGLTKCLFVTCQYSLGMNLEVALLQDFDGIQQMCSLVVERKPSGYGVGITHCKVSSPAS